MDHHQPTRRTSLLITALVVALLCWIAIVVTMAQWQMSPTFDEQNHVARGIAILHTGDIVLCFHHPPLANILQGLPVAWLPGTWFSTDMPSWTPGDKNCLNIWEAARTMLWEKADDGWQIIGWRAFRCCCLRWDWQC